MDYCTLAQVIGLISPGSPPLPRPVPPPYDDTVIAEAITEASRAIDRDVTNSDNGSDNYFLSETKTLETFTGNVTKNGDLLVYLHKPLVTSITAFFWRYRGDQPWIPADLSRITWDDYVATWWGGCLQRGNSVLVQVTYAGGYATSSSGLPGDIQRAATVLAARYYKEGSAGLSDLIGVAELGTVQYTKAVPLEVKDILSPYERPTPW
jgi:hypothetical protein